MINYIHVHPLIIGVGVSIVVFAVTWSLTWAGMDRKPGTYYCMDPQDNMKGESDPNAWRLKGRTFEGLMQRYFDVAKTIIGLDAGSITLLGGFLGFVAKNSASVNTARQVIGTPVIMFASSIAYLVLFLAFLALWYDDYLAVPGTFTAFRYTTSISLGISGLICFIIGYFWLAKEIVSFSWI